MRLYIRIISFLFFLEAFCFDSLLIAQNASGNKEDTVIITKLKINTKDSEYSPYLFGKKLFFVSNRPSEVGVLAWDQNFAVPSKIFEADKKDSVRFVHINVADGINETLNAGPVCISKSGIYYTSTSKKQNKKTDLETPLRIFYACFNSDSTLQKPIELDFNISDTITICHPAVLKDSILYFTYYYQSSTTATDIYYSLKKDSTWTTPVKCPLPVNSEFSEEFPFIYNNTLFFSSNRSEGKGGLDVYSYNLTSSEKIIGKMEEINSDKDDFGVFFSNKRSGYFSSNRNGNDDIYYFYTRNKPIFDNCTEQISNTYCYTLKEKDSFDTNDTLGMFYEWSFGDGYKGRGLTVNHCFPGEGVYNIELNVIEKKSGETFLNELSYELKVENEKQLYIYSFDTVPVKLQVEFNADYSNIENYTIEKYYWDFGDGKFYEGNKQNYTFKKPGTYKVKLLTEGTLNQVKTNFCIFKKIEVKEDFIIDINRPKKKPLYYNLSK